MVGIFDSGSGGAEALAFYRRMRPTDDVAFLADRENAPYGTKSEEEIISLSKRAIERLLSVGCERVLIACCTASTLYERLGREAKEVAIPIIEATAEAACRASESLKIAVISTEATKRSGAFPKAIRRISPTARVFSAACPGLVTLADMGYRDGDLGEKGVALIGRELAQLEGARFDTVILGCTHFSRFEETVGAMLSAKTVNSAKIGAELLAKETTPDERGSGRTIYL